jgi:CRP/FNR family transcriptional regulator
VLGGGTVFGRLGDRAQGAHAQALEASLVSTLRREDLENLVMRRPEVGLRIASLADERLALTEDRATDLAHKEVPGRLASLLLGSSRTKAASPPAVTRYAPDTPTNRSPA